MRYRNLTLIVTLLTLAVWGGAALIVGAAEAAGENQPDASVPSKIPDEARKTRNPIPANEASIENGKLLYSSQCTMCHGVAGDGTGELVQRFHYNMPDFTDAEFQKKRRNWFEVRSST